jgi:hypothetical protein
MKLIFNPVTANFDYVASTAADVGIDVSAFGSTLIDDADAATARTTLGLVAGGAGDIWVEKAGDTMTGQLFIDGSSDQIQLRVQAHSSQATNLQTWENSSGGIYLRIGNVGQIVQTANAVIDGNLFDMGGNVSTSTTGRMGFRNATIFTPGTTALLYYGMNNSVNVGTSSNNIADIYGAFSQVNLNAGYSGTVTNVYINRLAPGTVSGGTVTNLYGLYIQSMNTAATLNYAIYTNAGLNRLGDKLTVVGTTTLAAGLIHAYVAKTADYTLTETDYTVDFTANNCIATLLTAVGRTGQVFNIKNSGTGVVTINTTSSQTVDGNASGTLTLSQWENLTVQSNGANWIVL